jgi:hypothetical protein
LLLTPAKKNCTSAWANHSTRRSTQNGRSHTATLDTSAGCLQCLCFIGVTSVGCPCSRDNHVTVTNVHCCYKHRRIQGSSANLRTSTETPFGTAGVTRLSSFRVARLAFLVAARCLRVGGIRGIGVRSAGMNTAQTGWESKLVLRRGDASKSESDP